MKQLTLTKTEKFLFCLFFILAFGDMFTTMALGEISTKLESNPLVILTGSFIWVIVLNVIFGVTLLYCYRKQKTKTRFFIVAYICALAVLRIFAIYSALSIAADPPTLAEAASITTAEKINHISTTMLLFIILPMFVSQSAFWIFSLDHKIEKKEAKKPLRK